MTHPHPTRRSFLAASATLPAALALTTARAQDPAKKPGADILGEAGVASAERSKAVWTPVSDRKIRVGIAGFGVCQFGAAFGFQDHPNVTVAAVTDLFPDRCAALAKACRCEKTYESLEKMVEDDSLEAVFIATDAPSHMAHAIAALERGKHVASAVPAVFGSVEQAHQLHEKVKATGLTYMLFETSTFHQDCLAMRRIYEAGGFGDMTYTEGEYYHCSVEQIPSYKEWRVALPPQWYPTHSNAYHICVTGGHFTEVSCMARPSAKGPFADGNNQYKNPFATEIALFRTSEGGMSRMAVSWDTPGLEGETGRVRGNRGSMTGMTYQGLDQASLPDLSPLPLPPTLAPGGHGGSHGHLTNEFVTAILEGRKPLVDIAKALHLTVSGIVAHQSALRDGELLKIPTFA
jgi:predicted dehydrogenase